ncbi:MAG: hypothetical protein IH845_02410 [Nanoarchaeota archaeon]|nr:hypothetical protein [Nanoarchaeota archaeon]
MKQPLIIVLSVGVGWILGITIMMILLPIGGLFDYTFEEAMGTMIVFSFPGFVMFMIAIILSILEDDNPYEGQF